MPTSRFRRALPFLRICMTALVLPACAWSAMAQERPAPEAATGTAAKQVVRAERHMIVAAHPAAAAAGLAMLRAGGGAVDAAIAAQMVLGLVEPQSSGIGGGGFMLVHAAEGRRSLAYDGRETAPAAAGADLFLRPDGTRMDFFEAVVGGRAVGVPGLLPMLEAAHRAHGRLPWAELMAPAIRLAEEGFAVTPRLHMLLARDRYLAGDPAAAALFYGSDGEALPVGVRLRNPALADTMRRVAAEGAAAILTGPVAADIVAAVRGDAANPGLLSLADLAGYEPAVRAPLCATWRTFRICGIGPPSGGPLAVMQIVGLVERAEAVVGPVWTGDAAHVFAEASRLAFADRDRWVADPAFADVPAEGLVAATYLDDRARAIDFARSRPHPPAGAPPGRRTMRESSPADGIVRPPSTTHLSVVDGFGNAVALTSSIENAFGARRLVRGFLLNNQLTDFDFLPDADGRPVANRVEPGKRPRSSMAPLIVFDEADGRPVLVAGSPGGAAIIPFVAKALLAVLGGGPGGGSGDGLDPQAAAALPNLVARGGDTVLEADTALENIAPDLAARGHAVRTGAMASGLHLIHILPKGGLLGGADPRREGIALGD